VEVRLRDDVTQEGTEHAREIRELTYWKHRLGASDNAVRSALNKFGTDRRKMERELKRTIPRDF